MRLRLIAPVLLGFGIAAACGGNNDTSKVSGGSAASGNGTSSGVGGNGLILGNGGSAANGTGNGTGEGGDGTFDPDAACATSSADGEPIPVDLYFMVDITGSMDCPVPDVAGQAACEVQPKPPFSKTTRWTVESAALSAFVSDPTNAGLGMGINFCPSTNQNTICNAATYVKPAAEIAALPGAAAALNMVIGAQTPGGNTPTEPSLNGALQHAAAWAKMNPTHRVAVVYSTDGYPEGCDATNTIAAAAADAAAAFKATPSIPTYVLGVGPNLADLNSIAMSGGTTKAFLIDTSQDAATQLSAALASIRTTAVVGCTYTIPPPPAGQTLDPSKVNVTYTNPKGVVTNVLQDAPTTSCTDPNAMGWEYSTDGTQINLCGGLCTSIKADPGGSLKVLFGCATQVGGTIK
jgi:hypothetical protein